MENLKMKYRKPSQLIHFTEKLENFLLNIREEKLLHNIENPKEFKANHCILYKVRLVFSFITTRVINLWELRNSIDWK